MKATIIEKYIVKNGEIRDFLAKMEYYADFREGILQDNFIGHDDNGTLYVVLEKHTNAWFSDLLVYESDGKPENDRFLWQVWENFCEDFDKENPDAGHEH